MLVITMAAHLWPAWRSRTAWRALESGLSLIANLLQAWRSRTAWRALTMVLSLIAHLWLVWQSRTAWRALPTRRFSSCSSCKSRFAYTSDIIDVGIQNSGVEHVTPKRITEEEFQTAKFIMTDDEADLWESLYTKKDGYYERNKASEKELDTIFYKETIIETLTDNWYSKTFLFIESSITAKISDFYSLVNPLLSGNLIYKIYSWFIIDL